MTTFAAGMTGAQFLASLNYIQQFYNVKEYGAVGNGVIDDTVAIQSAINACITAGGGTVYFPNGIYIIGGALQTDIGGLNYNSQLYIPASTSSNTSRTTIVLRGETPPNFAQGGGLASAIPGTKGSIIRSTLANTTDNAFVIASIGESESWGDYNYNQTIIEDLQIQTTTNAGGANVIGGIDLSNSADCIIRNVSVYNWNTGVFDSIAPLYHCTGIAVGNINNDNTHSIYDCSVGGYESGFKVSEHASLVNTKSICCTYGYNFRNSGHPIYGSRVLAHWCVNSIYFSTRTHLKISEFIEEQYEAVGKWYSPSATILDSSNYGHGEIHYNSTRSGEGLPHNTFFIKTGGANLQCIPITFEGAASFTVTGATDTAKIASLIAVLEAKGIIIDGTT